MDSKEVLETFGISKNFGIVLLIQSIIVIIGCFFAIQSVYLCDIGGSLIGSLRYIMNLIFFLALLFYSFYAYRKNEGYFKWVLYLYVILLVISLITSIFSGMQLGILFKIVELIIVLYLIFNLSNYNKAKIAAILLVVVELVRVVYFLLAGLSPMGFLTLINFIPCVSIALTYFARYNDKGFKILL